MDNLKSRETAYQAMTKEPLRITIHLGTPIVFPTDGIALDALLAEVVAKELFGNQPDRWQDLDRQIELPLPLEKTQGTYPVWKASIGFSSTLAQEYQDFWVKRTNDEFAGYVSNKIVWPRGVIGDEVSKSLLKEVRIEKATGPANNPAKGGFKSYYESRNLLVTPAIIFHAVGNKEEIQRLLSKLESIGKKRAIGYGSIVKIEVTSSEKDYSLFTPTQKAARNLPVEDFPPMRARMISSRLTPPYWSKRDVVLCYAPASPIPAWEWSNENQATSIEDTWFDEEDDFFDE